MSEAIARELMAQRFRSYLPVVIDLETGGFNAHSDAVLEIAAVTLTMDPEGNLLPDATYAYHIQPFEGANVEQSALDFTGINLDDPLRRQVALSETEALGEIFRPIRKSIKAHGCSRAIFQSATMRRLIRGFLTLPLIAATLNAIRSTLSQVLTPRRWQALFTAKPYWPEPAVRPVSNLTIKQHTQHATIPNARRSYSAPWLTVIKTWADGAWPNESRTWMTVNNPKLDAVTWALR